MLDELGNPARVLEELLLALACLGVGGSLVGERDFQALVQEREFAQALCQRVVVEFGDGEDGLVWKEVDLGASALRGTHLAQLADGRTLGVVLLPRKTIAPDLDIELLRERVD